ncbi:hypothetical protein THAOC_16786, partial [Thalassiosira oceanica]
MILKFSRRTNVSSICFLRFFSKCAGSAPPGTRWATVRKSNKSHRDATSLPIYPERFESVRCLIRLPIRSETSRFQPSPIEEIAGPSSAAQIARLIALTDCELGSSSSGPITTRRAASSAVSPSSPTASAYLGQRSAAASSEPETASRSSSMRRALALPTLRTSLPPPPQPGEAPRSACTNWTVAPRDRDDQVRAGRELRAPSDREAVDRADGQDGEGEYQVTVSTGKARERGGRAKSYLAVRENKFPC